MKKILTIISTLLISAAVFAAENDSSKTTLNVKSSLPDMSFDVYGVLDMGFLYTDRNINPDRD
ncbi:hypothetical protein FACS189437_03870 [Bacteroidia bacterium]|nr:hypothetical protein FACS189437_03870 [Bacteroidia bacterium]